MAEAPAEGGTSPDADSPSPTTPVPGLENASAIGTPSTLPAPRTPRVGGGAAAKGRAWLTLPPGFAAARDGNLELLKALVKGSGGGGLDGRGASWDAAETVDKNGSVPLDWAAGEGRIEVCR